MRRSSIAALIFGALLASCAKLDYAAPDPTMEALCRVRPVLEEEAFLEDRAGFNWLGTTGRPIDRLPVAIPGYTPGPGARMEEMGLNYHTAGTLANVALGRGRGWGVPNTGDYVAGAPAETLPPLTGHGGEALVFDLGGSDCRLHDWIERRVAESQEVYVFHNLERLEIRQELETTVPAALRVLQRNMVAGRCLTARWAPRAELPLRAFRVSEMRRGPRYNYALSPHIVTRGEEVVYFSMGVVRQSHGARMGEPMGPDPAERVCCVTPLATGGCSRYGGPDPYMVHVRFLRAAWRPGDPS